MATWEEAAGLQTYEKLTAPSTIYKIIQKNDETNMSFVNRLNVAFQDLGEVTVKEMKAFILLKQSALTPYDKRRVIVMTAGKISAEKIEMAMRSPNTKVLGSGSTMDPKKKVYPVNYVEDEVEEAHNVIEDDAVDEEWILQSLVERCPGNN